eukprot:4371697-Amphidinium_carterae.1
MLLVLADPEKGHGEAHPRDRGAASRSSDRGLARHSPSTGGERVPAHPLSALMQSKAVELHTPRQSYEPPLCQKEMRCETSLHVLYCTSTG